MRIVICGDFLFSARNLKKRIDPKLVELLQSADAVFANAEFSTPKYGTPPGFTMWLTSVPQKTLDEFVDLNIRLVNFANNHSVDYGWEGCLHTIEAAEERDLLPCGIGHDLTEARRPRFLELGCGTVSCVAANSTWSYRALAANAGADTVARPGQAPLRWDHKYIVNDEQFEQLKAIDQALGLRESMDETGRVEVWEPQGENSFKFGSAMEHFLMIERGEKPGIKTWVNAEDEDALLRSIRDARRRSDFVIATLHSHEGQNENWYSPYSPEFKQEYARHCIDAGADVFVGTGAHYPRGLEIYKGKPIFHDLGSFIMEFESGHSMISPEMFNRYGLPADAYPSDLHGFRAKFPDGSWKGFNAERRFSEHIVVIVDVDEESGKADYSILPIDTDMQRENPLKRGFPMVASPEVCRKMVEDMTARSDIYGTQFVYDEESGRIRFRAPEV